MIRDWFHNKFGHRARILKKAYDIVSKVNEFESSVNALSDEELAGKTDYFKDLLSQGRTLDDILPEAFAVVRETSKRVLGLRHFDEQVIGGYALHNAFISEMKTGEGKTLAATLAIYLNALSGRGVHVITVNDYLAKRDAEWMGGIYRFLGLSVSYIYSGMSQKEKKEAYSADIIYGTNNEFAFDYLRDNMQVDSDNGVQRELYYAIVDEADSIFIDEARTPLVISGPVPGSEEVYKKVIKISDMMDDDDYEIDEKSRNAFLTDQGAEKVEKILVEFDLMKEGCSVYDKDNIKFLHIISQILKAVFVLKKDVDYIVKNGQIVIIDEFTGRTMEGRRYSEGLHQAIEAKEGVDIHSENKTLASITYQNYFRLYEKLAGMTGTASTEARELMDIYGLGVMEIPTHKNVIRVDEDDEIYATVIEKYKAVVSLVKECNEKKQPVLVGTVSIEKSEQIASLMKAEGLKCNVLNAKNHENEAYIIAQAGRPGAITIATNMAGRGTDIKLGGNADMLITKELYNIKDSKYLEKEKERICNEVLEGEKIVKEAGGLYVVGTERHEGRRIDNQLRGRSGRQGDPGYTKFFLSLEDDLLRIFGSGKVHGMMQRLGLKGEETIKHPWITKALEKAQKKVEERNSEIRKALFKFDMVVNEQRRIIFSQRKEVLSTKDCMSNFHSARTWYNQKLINECILENTYYEDWKIDVLEKEIFEVYTLNVDIRSIAAKDGVGKDEILQKINIDTEELFDQRKNMYGKDIVTAVQKRILIITLDNLWRDYLQSLDYLKQSVGLRSLGQKSPLMEFRRDAFEMFDAMIESYKREVVKHFAHLVLEPVDNNSMNRTVDNNKNILADNKNIENISVNNNTKDEEAIERNAPCPCGSGKRYKYCHGQV